MARVSVESDHHVPNTNPPTIILDRVVVDSPMFSFCASRLRSAGARAREGGAALEMLVRLENETRNKASLYVESECSTYRYPHAEDQDEHVLCIPSTWAVSATYLMFTREAISYSSCCWLASQIL